MSCAELIFERHGMLLVNSCQVRIAKDTMQVVVVRDDERAIA